MERKTKGSDYDVIIFRGGKKKSTSDQENAGVEDTSEKMNTEEATILADNPKKIEESLQNHENEKSNSDT